jgi:predicted Zn-dependent protease
VWVGLFCSQQGCFATIQAERLLTATYGKAVALRKLGRKDEATQVIQRVIHNTTYRHHLQMVAFGIVAAHEAGDDETARRWLTKARELYPGNPLIDQAAAAANLR